MASAESALPTVAQQVDRPPRTAATITDLPHEILERVVSHLAPRARHALASTCPYLYSLHTDPWAGRVRLGDPARASSIHTVRVASLAAGGTEPWDPHCQPFPCLGAPPSAPAAAAADAALVERMRAATTFELVTLPTTAALASLAAHIEDLRRQLGTSGFGRVPLFPQLHSLVITPTFFADLQDHYARHPTEAGRAVEAPESLALLIACSGVRHLCVQPVDDAHDAAAWPADRRDVFSQATREAHAALARTAELMRATWLELYDDGDPGKQYMFLTVVFPFLWMLNHHGYPYDTLQALPLDRGLVDAAVRHARQPTTASPATSADRSKFTFTAHGVQTETPVRLGVGIDSTYSFVAQSRQAAGDAADLAAPEAQGVASIGAVANHVVVSTGAVVDSEGTSTTVRLIGPSASEISAAQQGIVNPGRNVAVGFALPSTIDKLGLCPACGRDDWVRQPLVRVNVLQESPALAVTVYERLQKRAAGVLEGAGGLIFLATGGPVLAATAGVVELSGRVRRLWHTHL